MNQDAIIQSMELELKDFTETIEKRRDLIKSFQESSKAIDRFNWEQQMMGRESFQIRKDRC